MDINVEERVEKARAYFDEGYNCCQSVVLAYCDVFNIDKESAARMSAPFGGGMGRLREVCGAVSGMTMLAGQIVPYTDPTNKAVLKENYALVQNFAGQYREANGSIVCRELLAQGSKKTPCRELVAMAAGIVGKYLKDNK